MRISVKRLWGLLGLLGVTHLATASAAQDSTTEPNSPEAAGPAIELADELDRWVPSLSIAMGLMLQDIEGELESGEIQGPWLPQGIITVPSPQIRPGASGQDHALSPLANISIELMTPGLRAIPFLPDIELPGKPRLFVHGDVIPTFSPSYRTAKEGEPGPNELPEELTIQNFPVFEAVISGQGSVLESQVQRWVFAAGAGIAITTDIFERRLRIKPSFEWMTEEIEISGEVRRAAAINNPFPPGNGPRTRDDYRFIVLEGAKKKRFYGIGAGIEIEMDASRAGPFLFSVFADARGYRFMGNRKIEFTARNEFGVGECINDPTQPCSEEATFKIQKDRYAYRTSVGFRVRLAIE